MKVLDAKRTAVLQAWKIIQEYDLPRVERGGSHLSSKVVFLWNILRERFETGAECKCIVFVDQRLTALLLVDLLNQPNMRLTYLRPGPLVRCPRQLFGA